MTPILLEYFIIKTLRIAKGCPCQNGIMERYWKTLQIELIDRLHIQDESSIRYFCNIYKNYYNEIRHHQGIFSFVPSEPSQKKVIISN
jgi:transposase InsO family protein